MKKLLSLLFISILLTGCGNNAKEETTGNKKTCSVKDEESNITIIMDVEGENSKVKTVNFSLEMPGAKELSNSKEDLSHEDIKKIEKELQDEIGDEIIPGTKAKFRMSKDKTTCNTKINVADAEDETLEYIDFDEDFTFDDYIKCLEEEGFTCK